MIATLGNIIWSIKQNIFKASDQEKKLLLINLHDLQNLAKL